MSKHWFQAHLVEKFTKGKILGVDLGYGRGNWDEFKQCEFVSIDKQYTDTKPNVISDFNYNLPFRDDIFDVAICYSVLNYVKNYKLFLNEIRRVLKKDEYLVCVIPHENWNQSILDRVLKEAGFKSVIHRYLKERFYAIYYDKTSVYSYAILQNKK